MLLFSVKRAAEPKEATAVLWVLQLKDEVKPIAALTSKVNFPLMTATTEDNSRTDINRGGGQVRPVNLGQSGLEIGSSGRLVDTLI